MANHLYDALFGKHQGNEKPFLILPDGTEITYDAFLRLAARLAHVLTACGVETGERVAVQVDKCPEMIALFAACAQTGAVFLPLNTAYTPAEVEYFVENSEAKLFICAPGKAEALVPMAAKCGARQETLAQGAGSLLELAKGQPDTFETVARGPDDLAGFLYTSGTTGRSKGAMLTQDNLLSNAKTLLDYWQFSGDDVLLHALPIFHTHGLFVATNIILLAGGSMVFLPKLDIDQLVAWMPEATSMMGVPTFYTRLLDDPRFTRDLAAHMRLFVSGSAPLLAATHEAFEERTGHRILERYGMTETNMNTSNPYDGERRAGTVGFPLPGVEMKVCHPETGVELPRGEIGVVEVRGPNVFKGYWRMPEKTAEELREDGFFITGDLGRVDADGYLTIVGRNKDLIISGGYNIYPKEVELLLDAVEGVKESAVIGAPHPDFGESVVAVLVPEAGADLDVDDIAKGLESQLARFKQPRKFVVLPELPRNTMGKVQKNALRKSYQEIFA